ncbi:MAG: hypothetical protein R3F56_13685 [Planctomycetota bacterium]
MTDLPHPTDRKRQLLEATSPDAILRATNLTREQKVARLRQLSYDARELAVAAEEGMPGSVPPIDRIQAALRALGVEDSGTDTKQ